MSNNIDKPVRIVINFSSNNENPKQQCQCFANIEPPQLKPLNVDRRLQRCLD